MKKFKVRQSITDRSDESLKIFLREVAAIPLISIEREVELATLIQKGDRNALHELVNANLRFVISVAKQYQGRGLSLMDLIQEGICGSIKAAKTYDTTKGFRFISYAVWWIRQSIIKALQDNCRVIRIPLNQLATGSTIRKASEQFEQNYGRLPTVSELSEETGLDSEKIEMVLSLFTKTTSLDSPIDTGEVGSLLEIIPNENIESTDDSTNRSELVEEIARILKILPPRESDVIRMLFGIDMPVISNHTISEMFGIGEERVRQIQHSAFKKIRKFHSKKLKEML